MEQQKKVAATATPLLSQVSNRSDIEKLFAAFLAGQKPPEAPSEPSTSGSEKKLPEVLDVIKCNITRNFHSSKKPCKPNLKFIFYCDPHGYNKTHNSCGYKNKKKFHDNNASITNLNPKLGIMWNKDVYIIPGSDH